VLTSADLLYLSMRVNCGIAETVILSKVSFARCLASNAVACDNTCGVVQHNTNSIRYSTGILCPWNKGPTPSPFSPIHILTWRPPLSPFDSSSRLICSHHGNRKPNPRLGENRAYLWRSDIGRSSLSPNMERLVRVESSVATAVSNHAIPLLDPSPREAVHNADHPCNGGRSVPAW
jgi:hypothetical protein